jgi:hypothetical protein
MRVEVLSTRVGNLLDNLHYNKEQVRSPPCKFGGDKWGLGVAWNEMVPYGKRAHLGRNSALPTNAEDKDPHHRTKFTVLQRFS